MTTSGLHDLNELTGLRMGSKLTELRCLQEIELQLAAIRRNREGKARRVETQRNRIKQIEARRNENHATAKARQMKIDELSLDVASREDSVDKHRQALNNAKTNKEYAAILTALNTEKADSTKLETTILQLMDELGKMKAMGAEIETEQQKVLADVAAAEEVLRAYDAESRAELERLTSERDAVARKIEPTVMAVFDRAALRHDGEAMATVAKLRPKGDEWACAGCNMKVTLEIINSLFSRDEVKLCGVCGRIMYLDEGTVPVRS